MPIHAVLGATGSTGAAVLRCLLSSPEALEIRILIRSRMKLSRLFPNTDLEASIHSIHICIGDVSNREVLRECLRDAEVIYNCVGSNEIRVGNDLDAATARVVVEVLEELKGRAPLVLMNRTVGLNEAIPDPGPGPGLINSFMHWALDWVLDDMRAACRIYQVASEAGILSYVFVDGPKLVEGEPTGFELVRQGRTSTALNYGDLGAAFVEVGRRGDEFTDDAVGVSATGKVEVSIVGVLLSVLVLVGKGVRGKLLGW